MSATTYNRVQAAKAKVTHHKKGLSTIEKIAGVVPGVTPLEKLAKGETPNLYQLLPAQQELESLGPVGELAEEAGGVVEKGAEHLPLVGGIIKTAKEAEKSAKSLSEFLGEISKVSTWERVGKVIAGVLLIAFALYMFVKVATPSGVIPKGMKR